MSQADVESVYRQALRLAPDERQRLIDYLVNPPPPITVDEIMDRLKAHVAHLRDLGVVKIGLFGSYVRGEADPASDIDLLIHMNDQPYSLLRLAEISQYLEGLLGRPVDVVPADSLRPELRPTIMDEVIYVEGI